MLRPFHVSLGLMQSFAIATIHSSLVSAMLKRCSGAGPTLTVLPVRASRTSQFLGSSFLPRSIRRYFTPCGPTSTGTPKRQNPAPVSYTHLRAHETDSYLVCRLLLEKKKKIL